MSVPREGKERGSEVGWVGGCMSWLAGWGHTAIFGSISGGGKPQLFATICIRVGKFVSGELCVVKMVTETGRMLPYIAGDRLQHVYVYTACVAYVLYIHLCMHVCVCVWCGSRVERENAGVARGKI